MPITPEERENHPIGTCYKGNPYFYVKESETKYHIYASTEPFDRDYVPEQDLKNDWYLHNSNLSEFPEALRNYIKPPEPKKKCKICKRKVF